MRVAVVPEELALRVTPLLSGETTQVRASDPDLDALVVDPNAVDDGAVWSVLERTRAGARLLLLGGPDDRWSEPLGVRAGEAVAGTEVFATCTDESSLTARSIGEFPVAGTLHTLEALDERVATVLTSSIRYAHRPAVVERPLGDGHVVVSGFGADALATPELTRILARALRPRQGSSDTLGVGVVGYGPYGGMGYLHGTAATETAGLDFVATADPAIDRRKAAEKEFPGVETYADAATMMGEEGVDVVVIATPPSSHADLARRALDAGKHVAVEKPLCITTDEADALLRAAAANDRVLTVHQNRRWDPDFLALRRAVDGGLLGDVFNIETFVGSFEHPCRAWHSEESVSGGAIYDWGSHHLDWILLLFPDDPTTVVTTRHKRVWHDITNDDQVRVRLAWADGREAEFVYSEVAGVRRPKFYVQGTVGTIAAHYRPFVTETVTPGLGYHRFESHHAEAPVDLTLARYEPTWGLTETTLPPVPVEAWPFHRNLADHILLDEPLSVDPVSVRRVIGVLEAAQRSGAEGGRMLDLDLSSRR